MKWILDNVPDAKIAHENDQLVRDMILAYLEFN